jgi:hypothetical protein
MRLLLEKADMRGVRARDFANTVGFLTPVARIDAANRRPPRPFTGWLGIRVEAIKNLGLRPNPITEEPKNPYHALLPLEQFREEIHADNLAHRLARASEELGLIAPSDGGTANPGRIDATWSHVIAALHSAGAAAGRRIRDLFL